MRFSTLLRIRYNLRSNDSASPPVINTCFTAGSVDKASLPKISELVGTARKCISVNPSRSTSSIKTRRMSP